MSDSMTTALKIERQLENAPIGTRAPAMAGGWWCRTELGWKWR